METQDSYPVTTTTETNDTSSSADMSTSDHRYQHSNNARAIRESLVSTSSRRSTMVMRPIDHSEPPVDNPNNSPETNAQLRVEYERVKQLNQMMETMIKNFQEASLHIESFSKVVDETEGLLDIWVDIVTQMQRSKRLLEDPSLEKKPTPNEPLPPPSTTATKTATPIPPPPSITTTAIPKSTVTANTNVSIKRTRVPAPVGTHMTKKLRTLSDRPRMI